MTLTTLFRAALAGLALAAAAPADSTAQPWPPLSGTVSARSGGVLADVTLLIELVAPPRVSERLGRPQPVAVGATDAEGRFRVDLAALAPGLEWNQVETVVLLLRKEGFQPEAQHLSRQAMAAPRVIRLAPKGGAAAPFDEATRTALDPLTSKSVDTLFVIPYTIAADAAAGLKDFNEKLASGIRLNINNHLSALSEKAPLTQTISVNALPALLGIDPDSTDRVIAIADYVKALGIVGGRVDVAAGGTGQSVSITSLYTLGRLPIEDSRVHDVPDEFDASDVQAPARLRAKLSRRWARLTVIARALKRYELAVEQGDAEQLRLVHRLLLAERGGAGPGNNDLVPTLNNLIGETEKALRRLGQL